MANKVNVKKTQDVGWTYSRRASEDKAQSVLEYTDDFEGFLGRLPAMRSGHPDITGMGLIGISASRVEGGQVKVKLEYETYTVTFPDDPEAEDQRVKRYDFEFATQEEHILTNDRYKDLSDAERIVLLTLCNGVEADEFKKLSAKVTSDLGKEVLAKIRKGFTHPLVPGLIWIERFTTNNLAEVEIGKIGNVMDPPGPHPDPGDERNYLYLGSTGRNSEDGESWDIERRWRLSAKGKWDPIYNQEEAP